MNEVLGVGLRRSNVMASTAGSSRLDLFHSFGCLDFYEIKKKRLRMVYILLILGKWIECLAFLTSGNNLGRRVSKVHTLKTP